MSDVINNEAMDKEEAQAQNESCCGNDSCQCEEEVELSEADTLRKEIKALKEEVEAAKNDYYKAFADAQNHKRRLQQDYETNMKYRIQSFVTEILPAIDNFERALAVEVEDETTKSYIKGYQMIYDQLMSALTNEGIEVIPTLNEPFDPNFHHAIMVEKQEGVEEGIVLQELQKGYKLKDRIIRASMVKVSE